MVPTEGRLAEEAEKTGIPVLIAGYRQAQWVQAADNRFRPSSSYRLELIRTIRQVESDLIPKLREADVEVVYTQTLVIPWGAYCAARLGVPHVLGIREYGLADHGFRFLAGYEESLNALLEIKGQLEYYLPEDSGNNKRALAYLWRDVLWAIWGKDSENGGRKVIKEAPVQLRELYEQIFH